jgi:hypothetical protein
MSWKAFQHQKRDLRLPKLGIVVAPAPLKSPLGTISNAYVVRDLPNGSTESKYQVGDNDEHFPAVDITQLAVLRKESASRIQADIKPFDLLKAAPYIVPVHS